MALPFAEALERLRLLVLECYVAPQEMNRSTNRLGDAFGIPAPGEQRASALRGGRIASGTMAMDYKNYGKRPSRNRSAKQGT
jgi:hypothetical protein